MSLFSFFNSQPPYNRLKAAQRTQGLDYFADICAGASVLDVACGKGNVARLFHEYDVRLFHGLDSNPKNIQEIRFLFEKATTEHQFLCTHLNEYATFAEQLRSDYDLVLFLDFYSYLLKKNEADTINYVVKCLAKRARRWFVFRDPHIPEQLHELILSLNFNLVHDKTYSEKLGPLFIYERNP